MSGLLAGKVWQSGLDAHLKPLAAALADIANDDGTSIYPSVAYVAWLLGRTDRAVRTGLSELRLRGILETVRATKGGRFCTNEYRLAESKLPRRPPWRKPGNGETVSGFPGHNPEVCDTKPGSLRQETLKPTSPYPSLTVKNRKSNANPAAAPSVWTATGVDSAEVPGAFRELAESLWPTCGRTPLFEFMGTVLDACRTLNLKYPRAWVKRKSELRGGAAAAMPLGEPIRELELAEWQR